MPSRRRPKAPPPRPLSDAERFAQSLRDSEEADRRAKQAEIDRKADIEQRKIDAAEQAARLRRAQAAHQRAVEVVKEATRTGKGAAEADLAWRDAKAELLELETGKRPAWAAARPVEPTEPAESSETSESADGDDAEGEGEGEGDNDAD
ncbi:MAG: hypothetical protein ABI706_20865 [Ilumatobacteraceae bacterium]